MKAITQIRLELDEAITYGNFKAARQLAQIGLDMSGHKENLNEIEYFKGQLEILNEDYSKAIECFRKAIEYDQNDGAAYNDLALCMIEIGKIDEALVYFDKGIDVEPDFATIYHNKGWLLNKIGLHKQALDCFHKALELDSSRAVTYENLADVYFQLGDYKIALKMLHKAIEVIKPQYQDIRKQLMNKLREIKDIV